MVTIENIQKSYRLLLYVQHNLSLEKLKIIYDTNMAQHLWDKFLYYDRNLLLFINYLDTGNFDLFFKLGFEDNLLFDE